MNRTELVSAVADRSGHPCQAAGEVLSVLGEVVGEALVTGAKVTLPGLLTAERVERAERQGRHSQTGQALTTGASFGVRLTASPRSRPR